MPRYWTVGPVARSIECYELGPGRYRLQKHAARTDVLTVDGLPGLAVDLARIWLHV